MCSRKLDTAIHIHINGASPTRKQQLHVTARKQCRSDLKKTIHKRERVAKNIENTSFYQVNINPYLKEYLYQSLASNTSFY